VAVDGKTLGGLRVGEKAVHLMSAFAGEARWVVGQVGVDGNSNEIGVTPDWLEVLELRGETVASSMKAASWLRYFKNSTSTVSSLRIRSTWGRPIPARSAIGITGKSDSTV
jgi:hypothetical protein